MRKQTVEFSNRSTIENKSLRRANSVLLQIKKFHANAKKVLELGVGIGDVIKHFPTKFILSGLDIDKDAIGFAKKRLHNVTLFVSSMHKFECNKQDIIFSVFDSINYLQTFFQWKQTFRAVATNLNKDGLFIFDMYTSQIHRHSPRLVITEDAYGYFFDKVVSKGNYLYYDSVFFEKSGKDTYNKDTAQWKERTFLRRDVEKELQRYFKILQICDGDTLKKSKSNTTRILYVARLK